MAITVASRGASPNNTGATTQTWSHNNSGTTALYAAVFGTDAPTAFSYNGVSMGTAIATVSSAGVVGARVYLLTSPATGTHDFSVSFASAPSGAMMIMCVGLSGTDGSAPTRTVYTRTDGNGTGPGLTVTDSQNNDLVVHFANVYATTITFDGGETTTSTLSANPGGNGVSFGIGTKAAVGSNTAVGCTDVATYVEVGFAVKPAPSGVTLSGSAVTGGHQTPASGIAVPL